MELKTGYKNTKIGVIPEDWNVVRLEYVLKIRHGKSQKEVEVLNGKYPILGTGGEMGKTDSYLYNKPSVLIGRKGTIDKPRYMNTPFWTVDTLFYSEIYSNAIPKYLYYNFLLIDWYSHNEASGVPSLNASKIEQIQIPLPPLPEQTAITIVLSDTDNLIGALEKKIAKKQMIKKGAMQKLLSPKEDWVVKTLGEIGEIITGSTPATLIKEYWNGSIPWITPTDIAKKKNIYNSEREITKKGLKVIRKLPANSLLVTCIASIGKNAVLKNEGACNQQINAIIPNDDNNIDYLYYLIENNKKYLLGNAGITATLMISKKDFSKIIFSFPSIQEQTGIAEILSDMDSEIETLQKKLAKHKQLKQGLMQALLTGKIRLV